MSTTQRPCAAAPPERLVSLDAFRGFTIAAMLLVNDPGDWSHIHGPLEHAAWNGWTFTDLIFPFFIFISGMSMALSLGRRAETAPSRGALWAHAAQRAAVIFAIGLALNWSFLWSLEQLRIPGVLQRIALATFCTAPLVIYAGWRVQLAAALALLALYTALQLGVPVPDANGVVHTGSLHPGEDPGAWLDRRLMNGHLWASSKTWDPEGLLSTLPAVSEMLLGVLAGRWLRRAPNAAALHRGHLAAGGIALALGYALDAMSMPINKSLWTPAYVMLTLGLGLLVFTAFHALLDDGPAGRREPARRIAQPLVWFGMNALFLFTLSGIVGRALVFLHWPPGSTTTPKALLYAPIQSLPIAPENASLLYAIGFDTVMLAVAWLMWRRRWFVKV